MARIGILTPHLMTGDAVTNDVIGMRGALAAAGHEARIYAGSHTFPGLEVSHVSGIKDFLRSPTDLLIYHYSVGWEPGLEVLREAGCRVAIKYHNVTPPEFFAGVSPAHEKMCREGREQLQLIGRAGYDLYMADSAYNLREMLEAGASEARGRVVPPFHHIERLREAEPDFGILDRYRDGKTNLLMVGRVCPNKGHVDLLEAFATYYYQHNRNSRLLIVGREEAAFESYSHRLHELVTLLCLRPGVGIAGEVTESELKAYYMVAGAFVITSEHEGFCVPVVEAMAMKVPVVGYGAGAVEETVGGAGVVWEERDAALLARSVDRITRDGSAGFDLGMSGWTRYEEFFTNEVIGATFLRAVGDIL